MAADEPSFPGLNPDQPLIGHDALTAGLTQSMESGRVAHGWLLTGPVGSGKGLMARMAAAWILAENRDQGNLLIPGEAAGFSIDPDDPGTGLVIRSSHPDLSIIEPDLEDNKSGQIKLAQIRKLIAFMGHKPARDGWRVAIIDSMDDVNRNGANALLKLLEEPPEKTVLFLTASRPGRLPPTIRSRCRVVRIAAPELDSCVELLGELMPDGGLPHKDLAHLAEGAPGRALRLAESGAADCYVAVCRLLAAPVLDAPALATICTKWGKGGADGAALREGAQWLIARLLRLSAISAGAGPSTDTCEFERPAVAHLCAVHSADRLATAHAEFLESAQKADGLYLDFAHFLERELTKLHQKSLP